MLGLATGSTPIGIYRELIRLHREEGLSFGNVVSFNLDEYHPMDPESIHSYHRYMRENLFDHIDISRDHVHLPRGDLPREQLEAHCAEYERRIRELGGIDFQTLGIGKTGHIGFNEPGSGVESRTRLVALDTLTRRDAAADFFGEDNVPTEAVTMGVATIMEAREIALIATGEHKAAIVRRAVEGEIDPDVAATYLQEHPNAVFYVDQAASAELTRVKTPWVAGEVQWTRPLEIQAVIHRGPAGAAGVLCHGGVRGAPGRQAAADGNAAREASGPGRVRPPPPHLDRGEQPPNLRSRTCVDRPSHGSSAAREFSWPRCSFSAPARHASRKARRAPLWTAPDRAGGR